MRTYRTMYCYIFRNQKTGEYRKYYGPNYSAVVAKSKVGITSKDTYDWKLINSSHSFKRR
jgi:hypothetical protein